jgi:peptidyl-prolyl cis-trans isomerase D
MLQRIREGVGRWVAGIILGLIAVAFIFWGVDFNLAGTTFAAKVNGEDIPIAEFDRALQTQQNEYQELYRMEFTDELQRELRRNVLERLIRNEALSQRVEEAGYRVSDERIAASIREAPAFQVDGEFSIDVYRSRLLYQGLSPAAFEELQRQQLELIELQRGIGSSAFYTTSELRRYIELYDQQREIAYALFEIDAFAADVELDPASIVAHYEDNKARYYTEESVDLEYIELVRSELAEAIEVTDEELEAYYEDEKYRYQTAEERRARHILVNADEDEEDAAARSREILARLEAGEDFAALANELSDDPGTSGQGGDLGWVSRGLLVGPFEDALFAMAVGEVRGPVRTDFGYHIIRLDEIRAEDLQPFAAIRDELAGEYRNQLVEERFYEQANELADTAFDAFDELASVATQLQLPLSTFEGFTRTGSSSPFPNNAPVVQAAFSSEVMEQGENSALVELSDGHVLVLRVAAHHPPAEQPLAVVRAEIEEELLRAAAGRRADDAAAAFLSQAELAGALEAAAQETGGAWHPPAWVGRTSSDIPTEILATAFRLRKPAEGETLRERVSLASGDHAVLLLSGVRPGDPDAVSREDRQQQVTQLADQTAMFELSSYSGEVRNNATVRIPDIVLNPPLY